MVVVVGVILASLAGAAVVHERKRRREMRRGLQALTQLLLIRARLQDRRWTLAADNAVLLAERPGRMREVVRNAFVGAPGPVSIPGQRHPEPARAHAAAGTSGFAAEPTLGRLSDNLLVGGAVGVTALADWWHVDASVFRAVEALTHEHIGNAIDLWSTVHEHHYRLGEALFTSLRGHVGEQMAAAHLAQAGLHVDWPGASNQPGWDLGVDHHLMNVKVTANAASTLSEHFSKYPHIPALVNVDASNIPHDALVFDPSHGLDPSALVGDHLTLVDQALSLHDAGGAVHDAFGADVLTDAHIPVVGVLVTAVRSGIREGKLVGSGDTDTSRAMKNVAVDTTARGLGVIAGAKAGALTGGMLDLGTGGATLGLGAVFGGIAGAIAGAMGGSVVASHVRQQPLRNAQDSTKRALETYAAQVETQQAWVEAEVDEAQKAAQATLTERAKLAAAQEADDIERARGELRVAATFDASRVLADSFADLESRCAALDPHVVSAAGATDVPESYVRRALQRRLAHLRGRAERRAATAGLGDQTSEKFWDIVAVSVDGDATLHRYVADRIQTQRAIHARCVEHAVLQTASVDNARAAAQQSIQACAVAAHECARTTLEPAAKVLEAAHATYEKEVRAAGLAQ